MPKLKFSGNGLLFLIVLVVISIYGTTFYKLAFLGQRSDAALRPMIVIAAFCWIVFTMREQLLHLPIRVFWPGLAAIAVAGLVWLVGELVYIQMLVNLAVVMLIPFTVLTAMGLHWFRALLFPFAYLFFIVPVGGPLEPILVEWTAAVAFAAIKASGIDVYRDGAYFELTSGRWTVADACSGLQYLTTCVMLGALFAWLLYQRLHKRILFFIGAVLVGVAGNWLRVYLTIVIAHATDNRWLRDDHGNFGWFLFASLMAGLWLFGWRWRDSPVDASQTRVPQQNVTSAQLPAAICALTIVAVWPLIVRYTSNTPTLMSSPQVATLNTSNGWASTDLRAIDWVPDLQSPRATRIQTFEKDGRRVDVAIALFHRQSWSSHLVTSANQAVDSENKWWSVARRERVTAPFTSATVDINSATIVGPKGKAVVWQWYGIHGEMTADYLTGKKLLLKNRLNNKGDQAVWIAIAADASISQDVAHETLKQFVKDMSASIESPLAESRTTQ